MLDALASVPLTDASEPALTETGLALVRQMEEPLRNSRTRITQAVSEEEWAASRLHRPQDANQRGGHKQTPAKVAQGGVIPSGHPIASGEIAPYTLKRKKRPIHKQPGKTTVSALVFPATPDRHSGYSRP